MRWLLEAWDAAHSARRGGVDVRAVTAWALFGLDRLGQPGHPSRRPLRAGASSTSAARSRAPPRWARSLADLASGRSPAQPVLDSPGWWRRQDRLWVVPHADPYPHGFPPTALVDARSRARRSPADSDHRRRGHPGHGVRADLRGARPAAVSCCRGPSWTSRTRCPWPRPSSASGRGRWSTPPATCAWTTRKRMRIGVAARTRSARSGWPRRADGEDCDCCASRPTSCSTDTLGARTRGRPRGAAVGLRSQQGRRGGRGAGGLPSRADRQNQCVLRSMGRRPMWCTTPIAAFAAGRPWRAPSDQRVSPTYVPDLVNVALDLLIDGADGIWHLANDGDVSWSELARKVASAMGYSSDLVEDCLTEELRLCRGSARLQRAWAPNAVNDCRRSTTRCRDSCGTGPSASPAVSRDCRVTQ